MIYGRLLLTCLSALKWRARQVRLAAAGSRTDWHLRARDICADFRRRRAISIMLIVSAGSARTDLRGDV